MLPDFLKSKAGDNMPAPVIPFASATPDPPLYKEKAVRWSCAILAAFGGCFTLLIAGWIIWEGVIFLAGLYAEVLGKGLGKLMWPF